MDTKTCTTCQQELPITDFGHSSNTSDGRKDICKACSKEEKRKSNVSKDLSSFKARELIQELRDRGYKGTLSFTQEIKL